MPGRRGPRAAALVGVVALLATAGCTATSVDPQRSRTVVVTVDVPFESLNGATTAGRAPGSTLVRGLVQDRFTTLDETGTAVPDPAIGTVEKVSDNPLTVRYTIAPAARWSDGVPVTGDDLLLEWAARSGQLDEVLPDDAGDASSDGAHPTATSTVPTGGTTATSPVGSASPAASPGSTPSAASSGSPSPAADVVSFGAVSPVLVHAPAVPTVDEHGLTLVYADPVADWQTALDLNLAAHVVGRLALGGGATAVPTPNASTAAVPTSSGTPSAAPSASGTAADVAGAAHWSALVTSAIQHADRAALVPLSRVWRTAADARTLRGDLAAAVTTGPYRIGAVDPGKRVELVRNAAYAGARPAAYDRVVVRSDLDPVAQVDALRSGAADVVAPVDTADVRSALQKIANVRVATGGGAVLQLQLQESAGSAFDPARWASGGDDGTTRAAALRAALVGALDRQRLAALGSGSPSAAVLAGVGTRGSAAQPGSAPTGTPSAAPSASATSGAPAPTSSGGAGAGGAVPLRVLVSTDDQVRRDMLAALTEQLSPAGFTVTQAKPADPTTALWADPGSWDVALVPVPQSSSPVASVVARWRTGGATNVTAHRDAALDALLDAASRQIDPAAVPTGLDAIGAALTASDVVVPVVRQPVLAATVGSASATASPAGRPAVPQVPAIPWGSADLTSWWSWASTTR